MGTEQVTERILRFLSQTDYRPIKTRALARSLGIAEGEYGEFHDTVKALMKTGRIVLGSSKVLLLPEPTGRIAGKFRLNPRGFGFVIPDLPNAHGDLFIPPGKTQGALTGDSVVATVRRRGKRAGKSIFEGGITEIVSRGNNRFVGELCNEFGRWFVRPDGKTFHGMIFVDDPGAKSARPGDQVSVEIMKYPEDGSEARGVITRVLGERGLPEVDTLSMIVQHQLPEEFSDRVLRSARHASSSYDPNKVIGKREDLRKLTIITIDPDDARDFDDAISLTDNQDGTVELGVHIADVAHFVQPGSALDDEARERSTSVYFPKHVIPMLPEVLSNGVCSLQERVPRLTKSAFITYDKRGKVVRERFANSVIQSTKRLTYKQATRILDGHPGRVSAKVVKLVGKMERLAKVIRKRRITGGMLELDLPEVDLVFDKQDRVIGVKPADTSFSHKIIEMFMVEANEAVGRLLAGIPVPNLRRIHPEPSETAGESLLKFLGALGLKPPGAFDRFAIQKLLSRVRGRPESFAVNLAVLRSMQAAEYSPRLVGHFALAGKHYVHFTSPIRRYPDLTIHRLLDAYASGKLTSKKDIANMPSIAELEQAGAHASNNERRAQDAERELRQVKILRLLEEHQGDSFEGIVTGVTSFGIFVQLRKFLIDGLLRFNDLSNDWWEVDADRGCVVAERSGLRITIGQLLTVTIARVDVAGRQLDLALDKIPGDSTARRSRSSSAKTTGRGESKTGSPRQETQRKKKPTVSRPKKRGKPRKHGKPRKR